MTDSTRRCGLTLIELCVVLVLIGIILAIVMPRYGALLVRGTMRSEARRLAAMARYLSGEASRSGRVHYLNFDLRNGLYWVTVESDRGKAIEERTHLAKSHALAEGVRLRDVVVSGRGKKSSGIQQVAFYPRGESDEAIVHLSDYGKNRDYSLHMKPYAGRCELYDYYFKGYREKKFKAFM